VLIGWADDGIVLAYNCCELSQHSELAPRQFVEEVTHLIVVLVLCHSLLDGQLQFAQNLSHEHKVDQHILISLIQFVSASNKFETILQTLILVQFIESVYDSDECSFVALKFGTQEISHSKNNQVNTKMNVFIINIARLNKMADK
jgi:hypothetical protein